MEQKREIQFHVGIDDTDSHKGNCTTYLAALIIEKISKFVEFTDYPRLIRNNPNVPWKTRGNGSIAISFKAFYSEIEHITELIVQTIEKSYERDLNTNPGIVIIKGKVPSELEWFAQKTLTEVISIQNAKRIATKYSHKAIQFGNGRGLIGALAAVGNTLPPNQEDYTFELLTYRTPKKIGTKRNINRETVYKMDSLLKPFVFNNFDEEKKVILITPAGNDPVLYGIRGENPDVLLRAMKIIGVNEPIERFCIFRTNQATDQHFKYATHDIKNYTVFKGEIEITKNPKTHLGGHVFLEGKITETSKTIQIAAFEPSKKFRNIIRSLRLGDKFIAYGGIRYKEEINNFALQLEKCELVHVEKQYKEESPFCPKCSKRMTSAGYKKGFKCKKCGFKGRKYKKIKKLIKRDLKEGMYMPPAGAQRHLVKPFRRYHMEFPKQYKYNNQWWGVCAPKGQASK